MNHERNVGGLKENAQKKRQAAFEKTDQAIRQIIKEGKPISFQAVAKVADVSVAWLYKEQTIKERIETLRNQPIQKNTVPSQVKPSEDSKSAIAKTLKDSLKRKDAEIRGLRDHIEVITGRFVETDALNQQLQRNVERLEVDNQDLNKQNQKFQRLLVEARAEIDFYKNK